MDAFAKIAEERIKKAIEEGQFEGLANAGKPLVFEDETWIPEDLRLAYRILKNAGCIPPELELRNEALSLRRLIDTIDDDKERLARLRELEFKILKLNTIRKRAFSLEEFPEYEAKIIDRLTR